jgi:hypothetical protein
MRATRPGQSLLLLLDVAAHLEGQGIDYAVVGAVAASVYGAVRATTDADALVSLPLAALSRLERSLRKAGIQAELRRGGPDDPIPALLAVSDAFGNRVDVLGGLRGLDPAAFTRTYPVEFMGSTLRIIGREDFIAMKCYAGSPQDIADAEATLALAVGPVDLDLLRRVTRRFGRAAADVLERVLGD